MFRKINSYFPFQYCAKFIKKKKSFFSTGPSGAAIAAQSATGTACTTDFVTVMSPLHSLPDLLFDSTNSRVTNSH